MTSIITTANRITSGNTKISVGQNGLDPLVFSKGTIAGMKAWYKADTGVQADGAAHFTGSSSQYLSIASNATLQVASSAFSWSGWVYFDTIGTTQMIFEKGAGSFAITEYALFLNGSDNKLYFSVSNGSTSLQKTNPTVLTTATWYFFTCTYDPITTTTSVTVNNGTPATGSYDKGSYTNTSPLNIGTQTATIRFLNGRLDSLGFWKRVLTGPEQTYLHNGGVGRVGSELGIPGTDGSDLLTSRFAWYGFNEEVGTRYDGSGNGNHLTASNLAIISGATLNGNLESVNGAPPPVFNSWLQVAAGTSTVNDETSIVHSGSNALRFDVDSSNSSVDVHQNSILTLGNHYSLTFWARSSSAAGTLGCDSLGGNIITPTLTTSYVQYGVSGVANSSSFNIKRGNATSLSLYVDDLVLTDLGPVGIGGIAAGNAIDSNFAGQFLIGSGSRSLKTSPVGLGFGKQDITVAGWVNFDNLLPQTGTIIGLWGKANTGSATLTNQEYFCYLDSGALKFIMSNGTTSKIITSSVTPVVGVWYNIVCTYQSSTNTMSIIVNNGTAVTDTYSDGPTDRGNEWAIGKGFNNGFFTGRIDTVAVWSKLLSAAEITALFNTGSGVKSTSFTAAGISAPVSAWDYEKKNGLTADSVGSNTLTNTAVTFGQGVNYNPGIVSKWMDQSGNGNHLVQTTQSARPPYVSSAVNGRYSLLFDGIAQTIGVTAPSSVKVANKTIFVVVKSTASILTTQGIMGLGASNYYIGATATNATITSHQNTANTQKTVTGGTTAFDTSNFKLITYSFDDSADPNVTVIHYVNGTAISASPAMPLTDGYGANYGTTVNVGSITGAANFWAGYIAEIIFYDSVLSAAQLGQVNTYLNRKYAIY